MIWIDAGGLFAEMVKLKTIGDWADFLFIHRTVRTDNLALHGQLPVPGLIAGTALPNPTGSAETAILLDPEIGCDLDAPCSSSTVGAPVPNVLADHGSSTQIRLAGDRCRSPAAAQAQPARVWRRKIITASAMAPVTSKIGTRVALALLPARAGIDTRVLSTSAEAVH